MSRTSPAAREAPPPRKRLAPVRGVHGRAERPVGHPARLELLRGLVEHAYPAARVAPVRLHDAAHGVAEVLVLGKALRCAGEDALGDLRLAAQQREVPEVLRRAGRALPRETVAVDDLAALHPRAREAE